MVRTFERRQARIREIVTAAARHLHGGDVDGARIELDRLSAAGGPATIGDCRAATAMLNTAIATMVNLLCEHERGHYTFGVVLANEDGKLAIDNVDPPMRAAIRALLAELNGDNETATIELDLAFGGCDESTAGTIAAQSLVVAEELMKQCERNHKEIPPCLRL